MNLLRAMSVFASVVEAGSMTRAAKNLEVSTAVVSTWIAQLERFLGVRLLNRSTRRLRLTQEGAEYYRRCQNILQEVEEANDSVSSSTQKPQGNLRITAPLAFGRTHVAPVIARYRDRYPNLTIDLFLTDSIIDFAEAGFDLAIRSALLENSTLIARKLAELSRVVCASPEYLEEHGVPKIPSDLGSHNCLILSSESAADTIWRFQGKNGTESICASGNLRANNTEVLTQWAIAGFGVTLKSTWDVAAELEKGELVAILSDYVVQGYAIYAVYPDRLHLPARVRTFIEFAQEHFSSESPEIA